MMSIFRYLNRRPQGKGTRKNGRQRFLPNKNIFLKTKAVQEQNGFPWREVGFPSLEEVFKQVSSNDEGGFGDFQRDFGMRWEKGTLDDFKLPSSPKMFWGSPVSRKPLAFLSCRLSAVPRVQPARPLALRGARRLRGLKPALPARFRRPT